MLSGTWVPRHPADCAVYRPTLITWGSYTQTDDVLLQARLRQTKSSTTSTTTGRQLSENTQYTHTKLHAYLTDRFEIPNDDLGWQGQCNMPKGGMRYCLSCLTR